MPNGITVCDTVENIDFLVSLYPEDGKRRSSFMVDDSKIYRESEMRLCCGHYEEKFKYIGD